MLPVTSLPAFWMGNTCPSCFPILRWAIPYELCNIRTFRGLWKIWVMVLPVTSLLLTFQMQNKYPSFPPILTYSIPHRSCKISNFPVQLNIGQLVLLETTPLYTFWERIRYPSVSPTMPLPIPCELRKLRSFGALYKVWALVYSWWHLCRLMDLFPKFFILAPHYQVPITMLTNQYHEFLWAG